MAYKVKVRFPLARGLAPVVHLERLDEDAIGPIYVDAPAVEDRQWPGLYRADVAVDFPGIYSASVHYWQGGECVEVAPVYAVPALVAAVPPPGPAVAPTSPVVAHSVP